MKRIILIIALLPILLIGQTKNIVPRADSQGRLGTAAKAWLAIHADSVYLAGSVLQDIIQDSVDLRIPKDFSSLDSTYFATATEPMYIPININANAYRVSASDLPANTATTRLLAGKTDNSDFVTFQTEMYDTIAYLIALIGQKDTVTVDSPATPSNFYILSGKGVTATITLYWTMVGSYDSVGVWLSTDGGESYSTDAIAYIDSGITTYAHTSQSAGQTNWYYLRAYNGGIISKATSPVSGLVLDYNLWYVSTTGTGDGSSWSNKIAYTSFNQSLVEAGDTVFIDGGATGMTYTSKFTITSSGVSGNKVIYTRDFNDPDHDGQPSFEYPTGTRVPGFVVNANYVEISYMKFYPTNTTTYQGIAITLSGTHDIDILYNEFDWTNGWAITAFDNGCYNINIYHNNFYTQDLSGATLTAMQAATNANGGWGVQQDAIDLRYVSRINIGWNTFTSRTNLVKSPLPSADLSRDIIKLNYHDLGSTMTPSKIFNNFFIINHSNTASNIELITNQNGNGEQWFYNNIVVVHSGSTELWQLNNSPSVLNFRVYNNTFAINAANTSLANLSNVDLFSFKNNLVYSNRTDLFAGFNGTYDFSNNIYDGASFASFISSHDPTSSNAGFVLVDNDFTSLSSTASDYQIASGDGIDDGISLGSYFTTDYEDSTRGLAWDIGAFEGINGGTGGGGTGYGDELVTNTDFTSNTTGWDGLSSSATVKWYDSDWNGLSADYRQYVLLDSARTTSNVRVFSVLTEALSTAKTYRISFDYLIPSSGTTAERIQCLTTGVTNHQVVSVNTLDAWTTYTTDTYVPTGNNFNIVFRMQTSAESDAGITVGDKIYIDNVSVKEVLP